MNIIDAYIYKKGFHIILEVDTHGGRIETITKKQPEQQWKWEHGSNRIQHSPC
jgi:hypothetical protein